MFRKKQRVILFFFSTSFKAIALFAISVHGTPVAFSAFFCARNIVTPLNGDFARHPSPWLKTRRLFAKNSSIIFRSEFRSGSPFAHTRSSVKRPSSTSSPMNSRARRVRPPPTRLASQRDNELSIAIFKHSSAIQFIALVRSKQLSRSVSACLPRFHPREIPTAIRPPKRAAREKFHNANGETPIGAHCLGSQSKDRGEEKRSTREQSHILVTVACP